MSRLQAERAAKQMIMSGYRHHSYEEERLAYNALFHLEREDFLSLLESPVVRDVMLNYVEILGPNRLRAMQNSLICLIAPVCRMAIALGADVELSFALSDYYINLLETAATEEDIIDLAKEILTHYFDLVQNERRRNYTKPIANAVRYIGRNIYGPCRVAAVAQYVGLEPHYFSGLFAKQVGIPPSRYILKRKLEEAHRLLNQLASSVTEVAESLGFCDVAHFSRCFKAAYGLPPSQAGRQDMIYSRAGAYDEQIPKG